MTQADETRHEIEFYVQRCIKYHSYRSAFFAKLKTIMSFTTVLFGSAVAASLIAKAPAEFSIAASAVVVAFSAFDLVVGTARKSWDHNELKKRFYAVEIELLTINPGEFSDQHARDFQVKLRKIEADEPYGLPFLNAVAENDVIRAIYPSEQARLYVAKLPWFKRITANFIDWDVSRYLVTQA
ncbi:hypothetical protein OH708_23400 [Pseudomonas capsici]|uniref:hypothetical protein n=1 Tax=Pseudomonas capsici TaxID=2810614 RepID=UPI0021F19DF7|nr:hypothetical protein [Pseudomonas capsici]MCV4290863.1 hypothetical protein [Pseudomonas capsici]